MLEVHLGVQQLAEANGVVQRGRDTGEMGGDGLAGAVHIAQCRGGHGGPRIMSGWVSSL